MHDGVQPHSESQERREPRGHQQVWLLLLLSAFFDEPKSEENAFIAQEIDYTRPSGASTASAFWRAGVTAVSDLAQIWGRKTAQSSHKPEEEIRDNEREDWARRNDERCQRGG